MKRRQYFSNGSFEKGDTLADVLLWHRMAGTPAVLGESAGWEIDSGEAFHGSRSLKTATGAPLVLMEEVWEPIPREEPWVFSVYLKAERAGVPCELSVTLWWKFRRETVSVRVALTTEWKRHEVVVQGIPKLKRRSSDIQGAVNFRIAPLEKAAVWVDAAQWTRQTDASEDVREGPEDGDAPKWELPEVRVISRPEQSAGNWSGSVPLRVWRDGEGGSSRQPVAVGVPFGRGVWNGGGSVRLFAGNGREIPTQTEILTQWENGQSAQILGVFFTDKLEAGWRDYTLQIEASPSEEQPDDPFAWQAQPPDRPGLLWSGIAPLLGEAPLRGIGMDGTVYDSEWDGTAEWKMERDGPLHRVIRCAGRLVSREGRALLAYVARAHFWRDIPGVKLEISLANTRSEGSVRLRSLYWRVAEADGEDAEAMVWYDPESGEYQPGRFPLSLESRKILVHAPEAWQRHPSALARKNGEWRGYLWPDAPAKALAFPRGLSLTREFWLREVPDTPDDLAAWDADPIGIAAPEWWANTAPFAASDARRFPFVESRLGGRRLLDSLTPENIEATRAYGVFDFGDNHGDGGWGNLESFNDWCALLAGLRGGDEIALRAGLRGARHYRDIDIHQVSGACYEHTFNHVAGNADMSHAWPDGVALHYLLTGSKRSQEIIRLHGEYTLALRPEELAKGLRTLGRYLMNLAEGYQLTGDTRFRQRFDEQVRIARKLLAEDRENPDRSIFSYIGSWKTRRLVPFHAWYGIAALQKMEALTGDAELVALISDEIAATLNPELHHFDLRELWPGVAPERGMPLILADFARHRGSFFYPVMISEAERRNRPELARLALESLYAGVVEGRSARRLQAVLSFAALKGADKDRPESEWVDDARRLLWQAAADTLLNGDFALSPDYWHHWRPIATKSLSHHTNWQAVRLEMATLDADVRKSGVRSLRLNLLPIHSRDLVKLDTHRFRLEPGGHVLRGWLRWDEGGTPPRIDIEMCDLDGGFETVRLDETGTLEPPDAEGWRRMRMEFHVRQRTVANLFIYAQIRESAASGHLWLDGFHLEPCIS